jgi:hypothetical protein
MAALVTFAVLDLVLALRGVAPVPRLAARALVAGVGVGAAVGAAGGAMPTCSPPSDRARWPPRCAPPTSTAAGAPPMWSPPRSRW